MSALVPLTMFGWIPLVLTSFMLMPARRAVVTAYIVAWLFLPMASYPIPGFVDYDKASATNIGVLLGVIFFDSVRFARLRKVPLDWAIVAFCISPFFSSISNDLGAYDGVSQMLEHVVGWGIPYLIGRLYFADLEGLEALAVGIVTGGLVYVPLCLWEVRMSPQLHETFYGFQQHSFSQALRGEGYRPVVFMQHGLSVGFWMSMATLIAFRLWRDSKRPQIFSVPLYVIVTALAITAVLCKSFGAVLLLVTGLVATWIGRRTRSTLPVMALLAVPVAYVTVRTTDAWSGRSIVALTESFAPDRAQSLDFRLEAEDLLTDKARERLWLGWGAWGRNTVMQGEDGGIETVIDGLWIQVFGTQGLFGLVALLGMLLLPTAAFVRNCPPRTWSHPRVAPALALAVVVVLYMIDNLLNNMFNPLYVIAAGGLGAVRLARPQRAARKRAELRPIAQAAR